MDKKQARKELQTLRDSISKVLGESSNEEISEHIQQAQESASEGAKALKKSLIDRIKDLPVVTQVSQLGAAGTVAVSTAAVTQVDIAKDRTEVFVAEVAQDVVEERFEVPMFIDNFVDFASLNDWGQEVISEKIAEAQTFVQEASSQPQTSQPTAETSDTKQGTSASSNSSSSEKSSQSGQPEQTDKSQESENKEQESKEESSSKDNGSKEDNKDTQESDQEQKTEDKSESEQNESSSKSEPKSGDVNNNFPKVETPLEPMNDEIKPHSSIITVSPVK